MLINCDVKSLEIVVAAQLSGDNILSQEIIDKVDTHEVNRVRFNLGPNPTGRLVAKRFVFKLLYGATAYGYSTDTDFRDVGFSQKQWQDVIDEFYNKYTGIGNWHKDLIHEAQESGCLRIPSGRYYPIKPDYSGRKREPWPITVIKNYPVQGFGADLVMLARLQANRLIRQHHYGRRALPVCTIHDSLVYDVDKSEEVWYTVSLLLKQAVEDVPRLCGEIWNYEFNLPLTAEVQYGLNKADMQEIKFESQKG